MTYSLESFVRAYSGAFQSVWEKLAGLERITKPPKRNDMLAPDDYEAVSPDGYYGFEEPNLCGGPGCDGECCKPAQYTPGMHTATDRLCVYTSANGIDTAAICGVCRPVRDIVEQMIEERYGDQSERADTQDAKVWRAGFIDETWTNDGCCVFCGATKEYVARSGGCVGPLCPHTNFAGAAASLADTSGATVPSVREDKQRDEVTSLASVKSPADPHKTSPAASTAGDPSPIIASAAPQCAVDGEGSPTDSGIPQPPAGGRPTSELLNTAADFLSIHASRTESGEKTRAYIRETLLPELRDRAATFTDIEQSK